MQGVITTASHKGSSVLSTKPIIIKDINPTTEWENDIFCTVCSKRNSGLILGHSKPRK